MAGKPQNERLLEALAKLYYTSAGGNIIFAMLEEPDLQEVKRRAKEGQCKEALIR